MGQQKTIFVKEKYNGERLDQFLVATGFFAVRNDAKRAIEGGLVHVDGMAVRKQAFRVKRGMSITAAPQKTTTGEVITEKEMLVPMIVREERDFLVLNKPAGLAMHPAGRRSYTLSDWISTHYPQIIGIGEDKKRPGMVHRLDKETSGLVLIARSARAFRALKSLFQERRVEKTYFALVYGHLGEPSGRIEAPIGRVKGSEKRAIPLGKREFGGETRDALTEYALHTRYPQYDFLLVKPKTGRTHQIRVHLSSLGHPIVGDRLYRFKKHRSDPLKPAFQLLHAGKLAFTLGGKKYAFEVPLPGYFSDTLKMLSLRDA